MPAHRRLFRILLAGLLAPAVSLAVAACAGEEPFAPAEAGDPSVPAEAAPAEAVPAAGSLAALTSPRIAFISYRYNDWPNLFLMAPSGSNVTRLTSWTGYAGSPAWSYDNKHIAMYRERVDASNIRHGDIYLMDADGTHKHWLRASASSFEIADPSWSPDGSHLLVTANLGGSYISKLAVGTGALTPVGPAAVGTSPSYDPTGKKIIYVGPGNRTIERINADGSGHSVLFSNASAYFSGPRYSPDGKRIVFAKSVNNDLEIFVKNADGTVKRLTTSAGSDSEPSWSADGSRIAFTSWRSGQIHVYTMSSTGGSATRLTNTYIDSQPVYSH